MRKGLLIRDCLDVLPLEIDSLRGDDAPRGRFPAPHIQTILPIILLQYFFIKYYYIKLLAGRRYFQEMKSLVTKF